MPRGDSFRPGSEPVIGRREFLLGSAALLGSGLLARYGIAADNIDGPQYRTIEPVDLPADQPGAWTLYFAYTPVRILTVDTPDKGRRVIWYMVYKVYNKSDTPQTFYPEMELVTKDAPANYLDEPQPAIVKKIRQIEDPTGALNLHTCISISKDRIPVTKPDSIPRAVYGVAVWPDVAEKSAKTNNFSVYVTGLSNGLSRALTDTGDEVISRKTLQLDFNRPTDNFVNKLGDIKPNENNGLGAEKWIYRVTPGGRKKKAEK